MEPFVEVKMEEDKERILVEWDEEKAAARLADMKARLGVAFARYCVQSRSVFVLFLATVRVSI